MRRVSALIALIALLLLGLFISGAVSSSSRAQEASPAAGEEFDLPEGVSFEFMAFGLLPSEMEEQAELSMFRITFEPGAGFPVPESDPTTALVFIESGTVTFIADATIAVIRAISEGTPFPEEPEEIPMGTEFTLAPGDSALFPANVAVSVINNGSDTAVVLVAELAPERAFEDDLATPES